MNHNILVRVGAEISSLTSGLSRASRSVSRFSDETNRKFQSIAAAGTVFTGLGAALSLGLGVATKGAIEFEQQMSNIKAVSGATSDQMEKLNQLAQEMGAQTKYSSKEAAQGIEELIKAGVSLDDILNGGLEGALSLAVAGSLELAEAAEIASTALNAFKDDNLSVTQAADVLAGAANASATSVGELKYGLSMVSAVASGVGMTFNDTNTALAVFAQNGLKGSDAGTSLKTMLLNLSPSTKAASEQMEELGLLTEKGTSAFYNADGSIKSLAEISQLLKTNLKGLSDEQRQMALKTMFGTDAIRAANILYKEGAEGVNYMFGEMTKVKAVDVMNEKMNNVAGKIEELKGAFETAGIAIGTALLPAITAIIAPLQSMVDAFNNLSPSIQTTIAITLALIASLLLIGGPLLMIIGFIPQIVAGFGVFTTAISALAGGLTFLTGTVGLIIAAIVGLGIALIAAYNNVEWFNKAVNAVWDGLVTATKSVGKAISAAFGASLSWIVEKFGELKILTDETLPKIADFFKQLGDSIKDLSSAGFDLIVGKLIELKNTLKDAFGGDPKALTSVFSMIAPTIIGLLIGGIPGILIASSRFLPAIADGLQKNMPAITASIDKVVNGIVSFLENSFPTFVQTGLDFITNLIQGILSAIPAVVGVLTTVLSTVIETIATLLPIILNAGITILTTLLAGIVQALPMIFDAIIMLITTLVTIITENLPVVLDSGINILMALIDGLVQALPLLLAAALGLILSIVTALVENLPKILAAGIQILLALIDGILTILPVLIETALNLILQIVMTLIENLPKIIAAGVKILVALIEGIIQIIPQLIATAIKLIVQIVTTLAQNLPKILAAGAKILYELVKGILSVVWELVKAGGKLIAELVKGIVDGFGKVYDKGVEIVGEAIDGIKSTISDMVSVGEDIVSGIVKGIGNGFGWVKTKISELGGNITSWAASVLKIKSPSRVMRDDIGRWIPAGLAEGITRYSGVVVDAAKSLAEEAVPEVPAVSFGYNTPGMAGAGMMASFEGSNQRQSSSDPELLRAINRLESSLTGMRVDMDGETVGRLTRGSVNEGNAIDASLGRYFG